MSVGSGTARGPRGLGQDYGRCRPAQGEARRQGAQTLMPILDAHVLPASTIYTDEMPSYNGQRRGYEHKRIHHAAKVYVQGDVHTNTIDGFWMLLKPGIMGTHRAVSGKYLPD